jgi:hypothetical protein
LAIPGFESGPWVHKVSSLNTIPLKIKFQWKVWMGKYFAPSTSKHMSFSHRAHSFPANSSGDYNLSQHQLKSLMSKVLSKSNFFSTYEPES